MGVSIKIQKTGKTMLLSALGLSLWLALTAPAMADAGGGDGLGTFLAIGGVVLVLALIFILNRVRKKQEDSNELVFERMNAGVMEGRLTILIANLEDLVDGLTFRLEHDRASVLEQFKALSPARELQWQENLLDLAKRSSFDMGERGLTGKGLNKLQELLRYEEQIQNVEQSDIAALADRIIKTAGQAEGFFRDARYRLVVA